MPTKIDRAILRWINTSHIPTRYKEQESTAKLGMNRSLLLHVAPRRARRLSKFASFPLPSSRFSTCFTLLLQLPLLLPSRRQLNTLLHQIWSVATPHSALILLFQVGISPLAFNAPLKSAALFPPQPLPPARVPREAFPAAYCSDLYLTECPYPSIRAKVLLLSIVLLLFGMLLCATKSGCYGPAHTLH